MANYTKSTNFTAKDSLLTGNPSKLVRGTEIDIEFNNIATAVATKADTNSPTFTGTPAAPTAATGTSTTQIATTAFVNAQIAASGSGSFTDATFEVVDNTDATKKAMFESSGITTATTRTFTFPDKSGTLALTQDVGSLNAVNNTTTSGTYSVSASAIITITATHAFSIGQEVRVTFTNTSGSSLTAGNFLITGVTGTTAFTINYGSTVTSGGTVLVERYGMIAVANATDMSVGTNQIKAVTPKLLRDNTIILGTARTGSAISTVWTGIPSWAKRVTINLSSVSPSSASSILYVRLGTSSGVVATGYTSNRISVSTVPSVSANTETVAICAAGIDGTASSWSGQVVINKVDGNTWNASAQFMRRGDGAFNFCTGEITLASDLDRVALALSTGTFDAGTANIMYE
jgi:hypothetical protein